MYVEVTIHPIDIYKHIENPIPVLENIYSYIHKAGRELSKARKQSAYLAKYSSQLADASEAGPMHNEHQHIRIYLYPACLFYLKKDIPFR